MNEPTAQLTYAEFLEYAASHEGRFEYVDGRAVALASPKKPHQRLAMKLGAKFEAHLADRPCDVYQDTDVMTVPNARKPDVAVTCDPHDIEADDDVLRRPTLVVEILSPSSVADDLEDKLAEYQAMPSIEEYLVLDSRRRWVRLYYRGGEGLFIFDHDYISGAIRLASIGYSLDIDALYAQARIR